MKTLTFNQLKLFRACEIAYNLSERAGNCQPFFVGDLVEECLIEGLHMLFSGESVEFITNEIIKNFLSKLPGELHEHVDEELYYLNNIFFEFARSNPVKPKVKEILAVNKKLSFSVGGVKFIGTIDLIYKNNKGDTRILIIRPRSSLSDSGRYLIDTFVDYHLALFNQAELKSAYELEVLEIGTSLTRPKKTASGNISTKAGRYSYIELMKELEILRLELDMKFIKFSNHYEPNNHLFSLIPIIVTRQKYTKYFAELEIIANRLLNFDKNSTYRLNSMSICGNCIYNEECYNIYH